ncbi:MAG: HD domain-containing protein [Lachnospiraceae bacterium]|nr:HD domain-containing protein [Lachnospiraceae bacterium]
MSEKILILHREEEMRREIKDLIADEFEVLEAENLEKARQMIDEEGDTMLAIMVGITYPDKMGLIQVRTLAKEKIIGRIPVIVVSDEDNKEVEQQCFVLGISDFIHKPFYEIIIKSRIRNVVSINRKMHQLDSKILSQNETLNKQVKLLMKQTAELDRSNESTIEILGTVVECRNLENGNHVKRVKKYTHLLANTYMESYPGTGLTARKVEMISSACVLHDVGKIAIPDSILLKPGKLSEEEFAYMKGHTIRGEEIVNAIKESWNPEYASECAKICRWHHERYDGRGYPDGLKGEEIPIGVHCVALADVYDVLLSERVYKAAYTPDEAFHMIVQGECGVFSPKLVEVFSKLKGEFEKIHSESVHGNSKLHHTMDEEH